MASGPVTASPSAGTGWPLIHSDSGVTSPEPLVLPSWDATFDGVMDCSGDTADHHCIPAC